MLPLNNHWAHLKAAYSPRLRCAQACVSPTLVALARGEGGEAFAVKLADAGAGKLGYDGTTVGDSDGGKPGCGEVGELLGRRAGRAGAGLEDDQRVEELPLDGIRFPIRSTGRHEIAALL